MTTRIVIPARLASSRLPDKPLVDIGGIPMIVRVMQRAAAAGIGDVWVATDAARVADAVRAAGGRVELTALDHTSGTDRIGELARRFDWSDDDIVVNVQGDEPLMPPPLIGQVAALLRAHPEAGIATLAVPLNDPDEWRDPNVVKVVATPTGHALYFSRAPIPHGRDSAADALRTARRHLGLYAYRVAALQRMVAGAPTPLERLEKLEQLRALALGIAIVVADAEVAAGPGVDTPQDLTRVRELVARDTTVDE